MLQTPFLVLNLAISVFTVQTSHANSNHFAVNENQVEMALERSATVPIDEEMLQWLRQEAANNQDLPKKWLKALTTSKDRDEEKANPITLSDDCKEWDCALPILLKDSWIKVTYLFAKFHLNASKLSGLIIGGRSVADDFSDKEWPDVLRAAQDLPISWISHLDDQPLIRFSRGYYKTSGDPFTLGDASISLFDAWESHPSPLREYAIFHEFSHVRSFKLGYLYQSKEWLSLSGWSIPLNDQAQGQANPEDIQDPFTFDESEYHPNSNACFVSKYAESSPNEDLAETIAAYRFDSDSLQKKCPDKWKFVHEVVYDGYRFDGNFENTYSNQMTKAFVDSLLRSNSQWIKTTNVLGAKAKLSNCIKSLVTDLDPSHVTWTDSTARCFEAMVLPDLLNQYLPKQVENQEPIYQNLIVKNYPVLAKDHTLFDDSTDLRKSVFDHIKQTFANDLAIDAEKEFQSAGSRYTYNYHSTDSASGFCKEKARFFSLMSAENLRRDFGSMRIGEKWDLHPDTSSWINKWMEALCNQLHPVGKPLKAPNFEQIKSKVQQMLQ